MGSDKPRISTIKERVTVTPDPTPINVPVSAVHPSVEAPPLRPELREDDFAGAIYTLSNQVHTYTAKIVKMVQAINNIAKYVDLIPQIREDLRRTNTTVAQIETALTATREGLQVAQSRLDSYMDRDYVCVNADRITRLENTSGEFAMVDSRLDERLSHVAESVKKIDSLAANSEKSKRHFLLGFISLIVTLILTGISAAVTISWRASKLDSQVETNQLLQEQQMRAIREDVDSIKSANYTAVEALSTIRDSVERQADSGISFRDWYNGLSEREKTRLHRAVDARKIRKANGP